ncbi:hypothetical protein M8J77_007231 [Diaphorina citri]|nr:hypothetical protein M8J77_007231 [Diaphorina citri]
MSKNHKDLKNILKVKSCKSSSGSVSLINHITPSTSKNDENSDINNALRIANEIIETASLDVSKAAKDLTVAPEESKVGTYLHYLAVGLYDYKQVEE